MLLVKTLTHLGLEKMKDVLENFLLALGSLILPVCYKVPKSIISLVNIVIANLPHILKTFKKIKYNTKSPNKHLVF